MGSILLACFVGVLLVACQAYTYTPPPPKLEVPALEPVCYKLVCDKEK